MTLPEGSRPRMVEKTVQSAGAVPEAHPLRGWRSVFFAPVGDGQRRRRGSDGARLVLATLALAVCLLVIHFNSRVDQAIVQVIHPPPWSITWLVTVVYQAGSFGVVIVLVDQDPAHGRRTDRTEPDIARDLPAAREQGQAHQHDDDAGAA